MARRLEVGLTLFMGPLYEHLGLNRSVRYHLKEVALLKQLRFM